ncbi:MAG: ABC transporter permease [Armatimonadota bacterium]
MKSVCIGLAGLTAIISIGLLLAGVPILEGLRLLVQGAFGDRFAISQSFVRSTPLLLAGLGVAIAWKAGVFNIGGEGQLVIGALAGASVAKMLAAIGLPVVATLLILVASVFGGAAWSAIAGWLWIKRGVNLVISTILLNFIGVQLLVFSVDGPLRRAGQSAPMTDQLPDAWMLWKPSRQTDFHLGVLLALVVAFCVGWYVFRTRSGYLLRATGANPRFVRANRYRPEWIQFKAMLLSGGLCGLAGGVQYLGINGQLTSSFSQQYGFLAIPVALVGGLHPIGVVASSLFFGSLFAGTSNLSRFSGGGSYFVYVVQALAVLALLGYRLLAEQRQEAVA